MTSKSDKNRVWKTYDGKTCVDCGVKSTISARCADCWASREGDEE